MTSGLVVRHYGCPTASDAALCPGWLLQRSLCVRVRHGPSPTTKLLQVGVHHSAGKHPLPHGSSQLIQSRAARPRATAPFANGHRTHQARSSTPGFGFLSIRLQQQQQHTRQLIGFTGSFSWRELQPFIPTSSTPVFAVLLLLFTLCILVLFLFTSLEWEGVRALCAWG